jgi:hypothetical protein
MTMAKRATGKAAASHKAAKMSPEEQKAHDAAKHAPVSLQSGASYEREDLQKSLDKVVDGQLHNRDAEVAHALDHARSDAEHTDTSSPNAIPGHKVVDAQVQLVPGTKPGGDVDAREIGGVVVTERRQVFDADNQDDDDAASGLATQGGQPVVGNRSEVLSIEDAEDVVPALSSSENEEPSGGDQSSAGGD